MRPLHSLSQQLPQILSARSFAYFFKSTSDKEITEIDGNSVFSPITNTFRAMATLPVIWRTASSSITD